MNQGMEVALGVAVEDSEHAADLRRSSPFAGVLTNKERFAFFKNWSRRHVPHAY